MALTKISGEVIQSNIDISSTGIITATTFSGNLNGDVTGSVTGNVTGNLTGTATTATNAQGLTGTPNIVVGVTTASKLTVVDTANDQDVITISNTVAGSDGTTTNRYRSTGNSGNNWANLRVDAYSHNWAVGGSANTASPAVTIDSSGNFGIGQNSVTQFGTAYRTVELKNTDGGAIRFMDGSSTANSNDSIIYHNTSGFYLRANGSRDINFWTNGSERMKITNDGSIYAYNLSGSASAGAVLKLISDEIYRDTSSIQFKKDVEDIGESYAINLLENARPTWFRAKEDENPEHSYYGFIAEELAEVEPRLCVFEDGKPFSVDYAKFTPLLLKLLQMQNAQIKTLESQNASFEARISALEGGTTE